jgi:hypothetical protein
MKVQQATLINGAGRALEGPEAGIELRLYPELGILRGSFGMYGLASVCETTTRP